ncbi:histone-lysine N-methyltransferase ASHR3-like [Mangifera indica]|uniref:histone-lysine N-methyltransferase ASHR3-like n=1 Tax=Mangifera indica TaxID=29780 RepID=UPI001CFA5145|nr:histone-lysine N-methyltransferase ASHR3-like [Mangifera indica]
MAPHAKVTLTSPVSLSLSSSLAIARCPALKPLSSDSAAESPRADSSAQVLALTTDGDCCDDWDWSSRLVVMEIGAPSRLRSGAGSIVRAKKVSCFEEHVMAWIRKTMELEASPSKYYPPFLNGAKKMVECLVCCKTIYPGKEVFYTVRGCQGVYHLICAKERLGVSNTKKFKCPQHACFICRQKLQWQCVRCEIASHDKCAPWSDKVIHLKDQPGRAICWRHPADWKLDQKAS